MWSPAKEGGTSPKQPPPAKPPVKVVKGLLLEPVFVDGRLSDSIANAAADRLAGVRAGKGHGPPHSKGSGPAHMATHPTKGKGKGKGSPAPADHPFHSGSKGKGNKGKGAIISPRFSGQHFVSLEERLLQTMPKGYDAAARKPATSRAKPNVSVGGMNAPSKGMGKGKMNVKGGKGKGGKC